MLLVVAAGLLLAGEARAEGPYPNCWVNNDGRVLVIGDSLTVRLSNTNPLGAGCGQYDRWDVDGWAGRSTAEGVDDLQARVRNRHVAVLYDLGSNDVLYGGTRQALRDARAVADGRMLFLVTITRNDSWPYEQVNEAIRDFGANHARVRVIPWAGQAESSDFAPGDPVHYTAAGYAKRTAFIESRVEPVVLRYLKKNRR